MRQASSEGGAAILKGSATGSSVSYRIRSCFAFASIGVGVAQHADQTRVTILSLTVDPSMTKEARLSHFQAIEAKWLSTLTPQFVERLQARIIRLIPVIRKNAETFAIAGARIIGTRRLGDQIGALLAGAYALHSSKVITLDQASDWVGKQDWKDESAIQEQRDEFGCLQHIMEYVVRVQTSKGPADRSVGELISTAFDDKSDDQSLGAPAQETLKRYDIRVEDTAVVISNTHTDVAKILGGTQWAKNWGRILKRIDGSETTEPLRFGSGVMTRATRVPIAVALGD
jgi:putative DNA primase/helicase